METTLMTIDISVTDIEDNNNMEEESGGQQQLMVDMECPNCKVVNTFLKYIYDNGDFIIGLLVFATFDPIYIVISI